MPNEGLTRGGIVENEKAKRRLAELHGDLDAMEMIQRRVVRPLPVIGHSFMEFYGVTFEGKKHLWNMLSRLTSRVEKAIISDRDLQREVIHLAAKGRRA